MRKLIAALLAVLVLIGGATTALAAEKWSLPSGCVMNGDTLEVSTIITSTLTEAEKTFMRDWFSAYTDGSGQATLLGNDISSGDYVTFVLWDGSVYDGSKVQLMGSSIILDGQLARFITFSFSNGNYVRASSNPVTAGASFSYSGFCAVLGSNFQFHSSFNDWYVNAKYVSITDDDGLLEPEPEPEPSEPEPPPFVPPTIPDVPTVKSPYIPYDTSIWNTFSRLVVTSIGDGVNVGWIVFGMLMGIFIVLAVIRRWFPSRR